MVNTAIANSFQFSWIQPDSCADMVSSSEYPSWQASDATSAVGGDPDISVDYLSALRVITEESGAVVAASLSLRSAATPTIQAVVQTSARFGRKPW